MTIAYVALGSNLGDRRGYLNSALEALRENSAITVQKVSSFYETEPVGGPPDQDRYLNGAIEIKTTLSADDLLTFLLEVEERFGRERAERFGPRTLDLDLLLFGSEIRESRKLTLPHPRMHEREFVLRPLVEIAPKVVHPELGLTVQELWHQLNRDRAQQTVLASEQAQDLKGLRVMVTGSTSGIGRAMALELARAGASVLVHGRRSREVAEALTDQIQVLSSSRALLADLRVSEERDNLMQEAWQIWDGIDVWINNAGADTLTGEAANWSFEHKLNALWEVDVQATIHLSREIGERMRAGKGGVILNMGWDQAETGMEGDSGQLFAAIKSAIMGFSKSLALTLAPTVRVNCLAPGWIRTAWGESASEKWQERAQSETPLQRWGTPEDVAQVTRWLVSPAASFVTGQVIRVNGGAVR